MAPPHQVLRAMYDPIPWLIDEIDAHRRGLSGAGWYVIAYDGKPVVGPHDDPEGCILALRERADAERTGPAMRRRVS
jgi:hypothetical protein